MYDLIPQIVFFASLAVIVYLFVRAAPRVTNLDVLVEEKKDRLAHLVSKIPLEKIDAWLSATLEKTLRKAKVGTLKLDNTITRFLHKVRAPKNNEQGNERLDLFLREEIVIEESKEPK